MENRLIRRLAFNVVPALLIVGIAGYALIGEEGFLKREVFRQRLHATEAQVERLELENQILQVRIQALRTDPEAIRRAAASQLLTGEPGTTIYRFEAGQ